MSITSAFPLLKARWKTEKTPLKFFVQGEGKVALHRSNFKAQGGEAAIYVKGSHAYKIYTDPARTIPLAKIRELSALTDPNIIIPLNLLLDRTNRPVGYSMRHISKAFALCQLFPKAFRQRRNVTPELVLGLVRKLQEGVTHIHSKGILIVDLNEMNFLVSQDLREIFFIDVDSYQTPSFPATVIMESVRDRHANSFTVASDWFSFAVVSFQMFVGIHPFKGTYPPLESLVSKEKRLDVRMRANISVLRSGVSIPTSCLPFSFIPPAYVDWYRAVFEEGKRLPPPGAVQNVLILSTSEQENIESALFDVVEVKDFGDEILSYDGEVTITQKSIFFRGRRYSKPAGDVKVLITPRLRQLIAVSIETAGLRFLNLTAGKEIIHDYEAEEFMLAKGQLYIKQHTNIFLVEFIETARQTLLSLKPATNVMSKSTRMFEGLAIQNLLGTNYASVFPAPGMCYQLRLPELDSYRIVDAVLNHNVLIAIGTRQGSYDKLIYRFMDDFSSYDLRIMSDIQASGIDFKVLDSGVVLHLTDEDKLEVFFRQKDSTTIKVIQDPAIEGGVKLFNSGVQALIARGPRLYKIKLQH